MVGSIQSIQPHESATENTRGFNSPETFKSQPSIIPQIFIFVKAASFGTCNVHAQHSPSCQIGGSGCAFSWAAAGRAEQVGQGV